MTEFLGKYFAVLGEQRKYLPLLVVLFVVVSLLEVLSISLIGPFIALATSPQYLETYADWLQPLHRLGIVSDQGVVAAVGVALVAAFFIKSIVSYLSQIVVIKFGYRHQIELRSKLMGAFQNMPYEEYAARNNALFVQVANNQTTTFTNSMLIPSLYICAELVVLIAVSILLTITSPIASLSMISLLLFVFLIYDKVVKKKLKLAGERAATSQEGIIKGVTQGMAGFKEIRILGCEKYFEQEVERDSIEFSKAGISFQSLQLIPKILLELTMICFIVLFVALSFYYVSDSSSLIPTLTVFGIAAVRFMPSINRISVAVGRMRNSYYALEQLYNDLNWIKSIKTGKGSVGGTSAAANFAFGKIELCKVSHCYESSEAYSVRGISLEIAAGESVAIIGRSGAGKTTLLDLMLGLLSPTEGQILVNGTPMQDNLQSWVSRVAYIPQSIFLIDDKLSKNIALGKLDHEIDQEKLQEAVRQAQLSEVLNDLPNGMDTIIGDRGIRLSGGQRQRIALARAFYYERDVIIMDEATAALDTETEKQVVRSINLLKGKKTLIVIAHRLSTVENCERIIRMERGSIVDEGSYNDVVTERTQL